MTPLTVDSVVKDLEKLLALPDVCFRVTELVNDPNTSAMDLASEIRQDPGLTAHLLKVANSAYYGFPSRIDDVMRAVMIVGVQDLHAMVLATSVINTFSKYAPQVFDMERFWHHSFMTGLAAKHMGAYAQTPVLHRDRLFVAGLLHNIGQLALAIRMEEQIRNAVGDVNDFKSDERVREIQQQVLALDHAQVGAKLMKAWNLPESFQEVAACHHDLQKAEHYLLDCAVVHIAHVAVSQEVAEDNPGFADSHIDDLAWEVTGLNYSIVADCLEEVIGEYLGIESAFLTQTP